MFNRRKNTYKKTWQTFTESLERVTKMPADCSIQNARMCQFTLRCADPPLDGTRYLLLEKQQQHSLARKSAGQKQREQVS